MKCTIQIKYPLDSPARSPDLSPSQNILCIMQRKGLERVKSVKKIESYTMSDKNGTTFCSQKSNNWNFQFLD